MQFASPRLRRLLTAGSALSLVLAAASLAACYPEFRFGEPMGTGGAGGAGGEEEASASRAAASSGSGLGAGGSTSSSSATTGAQSSSATSTGSGPPAPSQVSCNQGGTVNPQLCERGDRCCVHQDDPQYDDCSDQSSCGANFFDMHCDGPEDCPGQICCVKMRLSAILQLPRFDNRSECADTCVYPSMPACHSASDCDGFFCSPLFDGFYTVEAPEYAPHYRVCD